MDDFWQIERLWAILAQKVYRNLRGKNIALVMKRLRTEVNKVTQRTLIKLVHDMPTKMQEIYRMKGEKIPGNFIPNEVHMLANVQFVWNNYYAEVKTNRCL